MSVFNSINKATIPLNFVQKAYTEGIYCDSPTNRKLGRVGMSYKAYAEKVAKEKEEKAPKKDYIISFPGKEEYPFKAGVSKESVIKEASKFAREIAEANDFKEYKFNVEEDIEDWSEEDLDQKEYDWLGFKVEKIDNKFYLSIFDFRKGEYIVNEILDKKIKDEKKKIDQQLKEERKRYGID